MSESNEMRLRREAWERQFNQATKIQQKHMCESPEQTKWRKARNKRKQARKRLLSPKARS